MGTPILIALITSSIAFVGTVGGLVYQVWKSKNDFHIDLSGKKTDFMAEEVARRLLKHGEAPYRSFRIIRHHIGGYTDQELRRILVRAGAIRVMSKSGEELWILVDRMIEKTGLDHVFYWKIDSDPSTPAESDLFGV